LKIGEFAELNQVTAKMLRHYDKIGLLKPASIDPETGYRSYTSEQSHLLNWIVILKSLDFSLSEIKELLSGPLDRRFVLRRLIRKRIEITSTLNEQIQKKIAIDRLISIIEKEGFDLNKKIDLQSIDIADVHEIKKNIPNMEMFLEAAADLISLCSQEDRFSIFRFDISHFKQVNDEYGFEVGDKVIVACYQIIEANVNKYGRHAAIGRAHGDEFIVFAQGNEDMISLTAQGIIHDIIHFDFAAIGCPKQMGCCIGGLVFQMDHRSDLRKIIEATIEVIEHAKRNGPNTFKIESYRGE
jgi:diguanylate cyclase (GGDEF)-like protein